MAISWMFLTLTLCDLIYSSAIETELMSVEYKSYGIIYYLIENTLKKPQENLVLSP